MPFPSRRSLQATPAHGTHGRESCLTQASVMPALLSVRNCLCGHGPQSTRADALSAAGPVPGRLVEDALTVEERPAVLLNQLQYPGRTIPERGDQRLGMGDDDDLGLGRGGGDEAGQRPDQV